jgi:hypothetical protein
MVGFAASILIALGALLMVTAEDWWPMGKRFLGLMLALAMLALMVRGAEYIWFA